MGTNLYSIRIDGKVLGPYTALVVRKLAAAGKIPSHAEIAGPDDIWYGIGAFTDLRQDPDVLTLRTEALPVRPSEIRSQGRFPGGLKVLLIIGAVALLGGMQVFSQRREEALEKKNKEKEAAAALEEAKASFNASQYPSAAYKFRKVPAGTTEYREAMHYLQDLLPPLLAEEKTKADAIANAEKERKDAERKTQNEVVHAHSACKAAAVSSAKWDGADTDWVPDYSSERPTADTILIVGHDVTMKNGFGASRHVTYKGLYSISEDKCAILAIE